MKHIQLKITANQLQQEELIALLDDHDPSGFEQTDEALTAYFEEKNFAKDDVLKIVARYQYATSEVEEQNWNEVWEQNFQPVVVDDFCAVRARFHQPIKGVQHELIITPKMSFGTGHHATTFLMMQQMSTIDFEGKTVFDFGTGTGILSILAEKLGASEVVAIDVDDWSIENAKENFERNNCSKITVSLSSNLPNAPFDVVLANINRNVILSYLKQLTTILKEKGLVLFSGLLITDEEEITQAAVANGLALRKKTTKDGWISLLFAF